MMHTLDALIVGAGPTGLTMACELARHGLSCRVMDQAEAPSIHSKALAVTSRTLETVEAMGITDELIAEGVKVHGVNIYANRQRIVHLSMDELETRYPYILSVPQSKTERTLEQLLSRLDGRVERPIQLTGFTQDDDGVTAIVHHAGAREEHIRARWLVGCDGAHSAVRHVLGLPFKGTRYEEAFMLADVRLDWGLPEDEAHVFFTPDGPVAAIPLPGGRHRLIVGVPQESAESDQTEGSLDQLRAIMDTRGLDWVRVSDPTWIAKFRIHRRMVPSFRVGRVFLAGDAAHIHSPVGGQGMNLGIQDAYNLAWKLALVTRGSGKPVLLDSYQAERHPIAAATLSGTDLATKIVTLRNPVAQALRNHLASFLSQRGHVQRRLTRAASGLIVNYRQSPIVAEPLGWRGGGAAPKAGDRAPDGTLLRPGSQASVRLYELLRTPCHHLFLFHGRSATTTDCQDLAEIGTHVQARYKELIDVRLVVQNSVLLEALREHDSILLDPDGSFHGQYGADSAWVYLLRPDGYIGYRCQPAEAEDLFYYLDAVFV